MRLSPHFTLAELTHSQAAKRLGLRNVPNDEQLANLKALCLHVLEPLRAALRLHVNPHATIYVSSGLRTPAVNRAVGGSAKSQHMLGQAADIIVPGVAPHEVMRILSFGTIPVDQAIEEFGEWTHVSYSNRLRRELLVARRTRTGTKYTEWRA